MHKHPGASSRRGAAPLRVLVADDHALIREGIRALFAGSPPITVVGEASNGRDAVRLAEKLAPDVILLDVSMPDLNGVEAARRIRARSPGVRILALSMHSDREVVSKMLEAGALGYLVKTSHGEQLVQAVLHVARDEVYLDSSIAQELFREYAAGLASSVRTGGSLLTPRQVEVLQLIAEGHTTKEIASLLEVSLKTVETFRRQIMERLDIHSIAGLTRYAVRQGLTEA